MGFISFPGMFIRLLMPIVYLGKSACWGCSRPTLLLLPISPLSIVFVNFHCKMTVLNAGAVVFVKAWGFLKEVFVHV
jgi:hypothetical protein